jgi:hypothetical protein
MAKWEENGTVEAGSELNTLYYENSVSFCNQCYNKTENRTLDCGSLFFLEKIWV